MTLCASRKWYVDIVILIASMYLLAAASGCSEEARARRSLKHVVHKEIDQFNKYHKREVKPEVFTGGGKCYRTYKERVEPVVSMRRTNSVDTPYLTTIAFTENLYLTRQRTDPAECKKDSHFILSSSDRREIIYAFSGGMWHRKEVY
jgi:hypothetical protein